MANLFGEIIGSAKGSIGKVARGKQYKIKDRVTGSNGSYRLNEVMDRNYGVNTKLLTSALLGNRQSLRKVASMATQGQTIQQLAPLVDKAMLDIMGGTEALNNTLATSLMSAGKGGLTIEKQLMDVALEALEYDTGKREALTTYNNSRQLINLDHEHFMRYVALKQFFDIEFTNIDQKDKLQKLMNQPKLKQLQADIAYDLELNKHILTYGHRRNEQLITRKRYDRRSSFWEALPGGEAIQSAVKFLTGG